MVSHISGSTRRARLLRSATAALVAMAVVLAFAPLTNAATLTNAWQAKIGTGGVNGSATLSVYLTGSGSLALKLAKLKPSTTLAVTLLKTSCSGKTLLTLASIKTSSSGAAARTSSLTVTQVNAIKAATTGTAEIAVRIGASTTAKCGVFVVQVVPPYIAASIPLGRSSVGVTTTPSGVIVANFSDGNLSRVDPATNTVLSVIPLTITGLEGPGPLAFGDGALWVGLVAVDSTGQNFVAGSVERVDPATYQVVATIPVGMEPIAMTTSPGAVWVSNVGDGTITRIDSASNAVIATIPVSGGVAGLAFGEGAIWVANPDAGTVSRIDPATNTVIAAIPTVAGPQDVVDLAGSIWVANWGTNNASDGVLSRIDPATNQAVRTIPVGINPASLAVGGGLIWVTGPHDPVLIAVNPVSNSIQSRTSTHVLDIGANGEAVGFSYLAATDHAVWAVQTFPPDPFSGPQPGRLTRVNF